MARRGKAGFCAGSVKSFFLALENSVIFFSSASRAERNALRDTPAIDCAPSWSPRKICEFSLVASKEDLTDCSRVLFIGSNQLA